MEFFETFGVFYVSKYLQIMIILLIVTTLLIVQNDCFPIWMTAQKAKTILVPLAIGSSALGWIRYGMALKDSGDLLPLPFNKFSKFDKFSKFSKFSKFDKFSKFNKMKIVIDNDEDDHEEHEELHDQEWW